MIHCSKQWLLLLAAYEPPAQEASKATDDDYNYNGDACNGARRKPLLISRRVDRVITTFRFKTHGLVVSGGRCALPAPSERFRALLARARSSIISTLLVVPGGACLASIGIVSSGACGAGGVAYGPRACAVTGCYSTSTYFA